MKGSCFFCCCVVWRRKPSYGSNWGFKALKEPDSFEVPPKSCSNIWDASAHPNQLTNQTHQPNPTHPTPTPPNPHHWKLLVPFVAPLSSSLSQPTQPKPSQPSPSQPNPSQPAGRRPFSPFRLVVRGTRCWWTPPPSPGSRCLARSRAPTERRSPQAASWEKRLRFPKLRGSCWFDGGMSWDDPQSHYAKKYNRFFPRV